MDDSFASVWLLQLLLQAGLSWHTNRSGLVSGYARAISNMVTAIIGGLLQGAFQLQ
jgi:hypothetical protein